MNKYLAVVTFVCLAGLAVSEASNSRDHLHWKLFKKSFGKVYADSGEESLRRSLFLATKRRVEQHNAQSAQRLGFKLGFSHLSDRTSDELNQMNGLKYDADVFQTLVEQHQEDLPDFMKRIMEVDVKSLPSEVDWRKVPGRVSSVKDQGQCGSCWSFATTGVLEGQQVPSNATSNGQLVPLSEQNLIDCSKDNLGCDGGNPYYALQDVAKEHGIDTEKDYPYLDVDGEVEHDCSFNAKRSLMNKVVGPKLLDKSEETIQKFVAKFGPVAVGIAATPNLQDYKSGVVKDPLCKTTQPNHAVLVVGYGTDPDQGDYWIVKNSWSSQWGDNGYFKLARNVNMCSITAMPMIPELR